VNERKNNGLENQHTEPSRELMCIVDFFLIFPKYHAYVRGVNTVFKQASAHFNTFLNISTRALLGLMWRRRRRILY
jgi:hypothetical protein